LKHFCQTSLRIGCRVINPALLGSRISGSVRDVMIPPEI
jgi:hypothetical protein